MVSKQPPVESPEEIKEVIGGDHLCRLAGIVSLFIAFVAPTSSIHCIAVVIEFLSSVSAHSCHGLE